MRLIVSDLHLGSPESQYKKLLPILAKADFKELYLVGDIFDLWITDFIDIKRECFDFFKVIDELLIQKIPINYFIGNHDEEIDVDDPVFDMINVKITDIENIMGKRVKFIHGDRYDYLMKKYYLSIRFFTWVLSLFKSNYQASLSSQKRTSKFHLLLDEVKKTAIKENSHVDILIMGHTHIAEDKLIDDVRYINTGDWVGDNTYVTEENGNFSLKKG